MTDIKLKNGEFFLVVVDNGRAGTTIETYGEAFIDKALNKDRGVVSKIKNVYVARYVNIVEKTVTVKELAI